MKKGWTIVVLVAVCLLCISSCTQREPYFPEPEQYTEADGPYECMTEEDRRIVQYFWETQSNYVPAGSNGLQNAIRADGQCFYVTQLGGMMTTDSLPDDAHYLGQATAPCEEYTTPQIDLQTNFAPEGCAVYKGWYTARSGDRERTFDMFFVQTEPGSEYYALMFVSSYSRPPYYDEGRWMLTPTND